MFPIRPVCRYYPPLDVFKCIILSIVTLAQDGFRYNINTDTELPFAPACERVIFSPVV